tara:strand:+ start:660 stop:845 length:186 start_codon:yes stop_codon:yes gene_type:complete
MDNQMRFTDADLQNLWMINPLASEQLKTIVLTRINKELQEEKKCTCNGKVSEKELEAVTES